MKNITKCDFLKSAYFSYFGIKLGQQDEQSVTNKSRVLYLSLYDYCTLCIVRFKD